MSVNIIFSLVEGGEAIALGDLFDLGSGGFGEGQPDPVELFIRHDGAQAISNVRLYIAPFSGSYIGVTNPQNDYDETLVAASNETFGHILISIDDEVTYAQISSSYGSSVATAIAIGSIAADASTSVFLKSVLSTANEGWTLGVRQLDLRVVYTFTE